MKLYFMKQTALDYMKANISSLYKYYYQFNTPEWIDDLFDYDPFEVFAEISDFELADLNQQPGEIDFQNCKILYTKLKSISDSQASDERLWAGLCNKTFYSYMRERWQFARRHLKKTAEDSDAVLLRYFYRNTGRSGMFRNTLARCWWTGRLTYSDKYDNHWELLDAIGAEDIISKISDIFYSNTYSSNIEIVEGFCQGLKFFRERGTYVSDRYHIRPTAQYLNAIGGGVLLDMFSAEEIKMLVIERLALLIKGNDSGLLDDVYTNDELNDNENLDNTFDAQEVNVDYVDFLDSLEIINTIDLTAILGELEEVEYGCQIVIKKSPDGIFYTMDMPKTGEQLNYLQQRFLGNKIGYVCKLGNNQYEIIDISR